MSEHVSAHAHAHSNGHGHTNYVKIWGLLVVLLIVSIIGPELGIRVVTLITAFGIAIVKAYIVAKHFMHMGIEKKWVTYILLAMVAFMLVMFAGVAPDVLEHDGQNWIKLYEEPAAGSGAPAAH
jgi:caa(3)-type oxidase subunit IV